MTVADWMIVAAVLIAPVVAVQVQKWLELLRETCRRKAHLFRTLMTTRGARMSRDHVGALNMIDIEFYGRGIWPLPIRWQTRAEKETVESWKVYHDHLNTLGPTPSDEERSAWFREGEKLFTDLLYAMAKGLGYHFDKVHLKRGIYTPQAYYDAEIATLILRDNLAKILRGEQSIPITWQVPADMLKKQDAIATGLLEHLDGKRTMKVRIESANERDQESL